jgi:hypothetical protein
MGIVEIYHAFFQLPVERGRNELLYGSIRCDNGEMIRVVEENSGGNIRSKGEPVSCKFFVLKLQHLSSYVQ